MCVLSFLKGCFNSLTHNYISINDQDRYVAIPKYRFANNLLQRELLKEVSNSENDFAFHHYDVCYTKSPIEIWDLSGREIVDTMNLFLVTHSYGMSFYRDSIFPYLVKGVVQSGVRMFFFYDSISINRLLKPINQVWFARKNENIEEYIWIAGGMESEIGFNLNESDHLHPILQNLIDARANFPMASKKWYFIDNNEFESQDGLNHFVIDTTDLDLGPAPLFPTRDNLWDWKKSEEELNNFISKNVRFPDENSIDNNVIPRRVIIHFIVECDGRISTKEIPYAKGDYWDKEALRIVSLFPPFIPSHIQGKPIRSRTSITIDFCDFYKDYESTIKNTETGKVP